LLCDLWLFQGVAASADSQFSLQRIADTVALSSRLDGRRKASVDEFAAALAKREEAYGRSSFVPTDDVSTLSPDTFYLDKVDNLHRRVYSKTPSA
jgi:hydroxymethylglutaryl-CoA synthase